MVNDEVKEILDIAKESDYFSDFEVSSERTYWYIPGSFLSFYFVNSLKSRKIVRDGLKSGSSLKQRVISNILPFYRFLPFTAKNVPYDSENNFPGEVIRIGARPKVFDLENRRVFTFGSNFSEEIELRNNLEDIGVNNPEILYYDEKMFVERFIEVEVFQGFNPESLTTVSSSIQQLFSFYNFKGVEEVNPVEDFSVEKNEIIQSIFSRLEGPYKRTEIHGDFHIGNLGLKGEKVYVFDWSGTRRGYLMDDFFYMLVQDYLDTDNRKYFEQVKEQNFKGEMQKIIELYNQEFNICEEDVRDYLLLFLAGKLEISNHPVYMELSEYFSS